MWMKWGWNIQIEDLRNHGPEAAMTLRCLLTCGAKILPDSKRGGFYEVENESTVYYIYAPTRYGKVLLLATWPSKSALEARDYEEPRISGANEESADMTYNR